MIKIDNTPSWTVYELNELVNRIIGGGTPSRNNPSFWNGIIPWASVKDFNDDFTYIDKTIEYITERGLTSSSSNLIEKDILILCTRMAVGRIGISKIPIAINQDLKALYLNNKVNARYLGLLVNHSRAKLESKSIGSTVKGISLIDLHSIKFLLPSLIEQKAIAEILDTIDNAIHATEKLIKKLKAMKKGLLHDLLTCGLDVNGNLRDPIAHPEQFKDSELGRIPKEWEVFKIREIAVHIGSGITPRGGSNVYKKSGILFIRSQNVTFEGLKLDDVAYIDNKIHKHMRRSEIYTFDVLINITGASIGRCCYVPENFPQANVNQHVCAIRLKKITKSDAYFLSSVLASNIGQHQIDILNAGGNREGLNYEQLGNFLIPLPQNTHERFVISQLLSIHEKHIQQQQSYFEKLKLLKKGLMNDLLTGRVRVKV